MITVNSNEEISTIFVVGFPDDMQEREFQNMFIFSPGFEAATLKVPNKDQEDDGMASGANPRKQIIGFAKFRSRMEAIEARDILSGRKVDAEKGSVLKAEMAKKNLHTKRGLSNDQSITNVSTFHSHLPPSTTVANSRYKGNGSTGSSSAFDVYYSLGPGGGPALPSDLLSPGPGDYGYDFLTDMYPPNTPETPVFAEPPFQRSQSFSQSLEGRHDGINSLVSGATRNPSISSANPIGFNPNTSTTSLNSLNSGISRASYSKSFLADIDDNPNHPLSYLSKSTPVHSAFPTSIFGNDDALSSRFNSLSINTNSINPPLSSPGLPSPSLPSPGFRPPNPADQNPPCNTLYVGNLPPNTSEEELKTLFSRCVGYKRLSFRNKPNGPMCFVEFEDVACATQALNDLYGSPLSNSLKGGIRLSFSKNPLGVRSNTLPIGINNMNGINGKSMDNAYNGLSLSLGSLSGSLGSINGVEMRTGIPQSPFGAPERRESFIFDPQLS